MRLEGLIAVRYLFAGKHKSAVNIISWISLVGLMVSTMALIIVLSVYNGIGDLTKQLFGTFDPELLIEPSEGKTFRLTELSSLAATEGVETVSQMAVETAWITYGGHNQAIVQLRGVDDQYSELNGIDTLLSEGQYLTRFADPPVYGLVVGGEIFFDMAMSLHSNTPVAIHIPKRGTTSMGFTMDEAFNIGYAYPVGYFFIQQDIDKKYVITHIDLVRQLMNYAPDECTALGVKLKPGADPQRVKQALRSSFSTHRFPLTVKDRYDQQPLYFKIFRSERLGIYLILSLIVLISTLSLVASLSLLIINKRDDVFKVSPNFAISRHDGLPAQLPQAGAKPIRAPIGHSGDDGVIHFRDTGHQRKLAFYHFAKIAHTDFIPAVADTDGGNVSFSALHKQRVELRGVCRYAYPAHIGIIAARVHAAPFYADERDRAVRIEQRGALLCIGGKRQDFSGNFLEKSLTIAICHHHTAEPAGIERPRQKIRPGRPVGFGVTRHIKAGGNQHIPPCQMQQRGGGSAAKIGRQIRSQLLHAARRMLQNDVFNGQHAHGSPLRDFMHKTKTAYFRYRYHLYAVINKCMNLQTAIFQLVGSVGHQRNVTGTLDRCGELTLVESTGTGDSAGQNLGSVGNVSSQLIDILVVNFLDVFHAEIANLLAALAASAFGSISHGKSSFVLYCVSVQNQKGRSSSATGVKSPSLPLW